MMVKALGSLWATYIRPHIAELLFPHKPGLSLNPRSPPDLLQLPRELLLPPDDYRDMILPLHHLHVGPAQPPLHVVGALHRDHLVVLPMEDVDLALHAVSDGVKVGIKLPGHAADDVVEGVPRGIVGVAAETFDQVCPEPEGNISLI